LTLGFCTPFFVQVKAHLPLLPHSSSGVKSSIARTLEQDKSILSDERERRALAYAFQEAAFAQIQDKIKMLFDTNVKNDTFGALVKGDDIEDLVISGGVAGNSFLRKCVQDTLKSIDRDNVKVHFPPISLCTDNAAMIAHAALISWNTTRSLDATPLPKWSIEDYSGAG
jgi:N6-L-threonylcarbamoyladenine synthase